MAIETVRVRQDGTRVVLIEGNGHYLVLPYQAALAVGKELISKARQAEEIAKSEGIIEEQALLLRVGAPFGLTNHPELQRIAAQEAAWNPQLRKYLPGGVKGDVQFGTPNIRQESPHE